MRLHAWLQIKPVLSVILILALLPIGPVLAQEQVTMVVPETASVTEAAFAEIPERLQRTFELLRTPGYHPELVELLGLESVSESPLPTAAPGALKTGYWVLIGVGVGLAVLVIIFAATCCSITFY